MAFPAEPVGVTPVRRILGGATSVCNHRSARDIPIAFEGHIKMLVCSRPVQLLVAFFVNRLGVSFGDLIVEKATDSRWGHLSKNNDEVLRQPKKTGNMKSHLSRSTIETTKVL